MVVLRYIGVSIKGKTEKRKRSKKKRTGATGGSPTSSCLNICSEVVAFAVGFLLISPDGSHLSSFWRRG